MELQVSNPVPGMGQPSDVKATVKSENIISILPLEIARAPFPSSRPSLMTTPAG
jgi:hypothetical protein